MTNYSMQTDEIEKKTYKKIEENKSDFQKKHLAKNTKVKKKKKKNLVRKCKLSRANFTTSHFG